MSAQRRPTRAAAMRRPVETHVNVASRRRSSPAPLPVDADIVTNRTRRRPESRTLCPTPDPGRQLVATREYTTYDGISRAARRQELRRRRRVRLSVLVVA